MIEQLMERTDPGAATVDESRLADVFAPPRRIPTRGRPPILRWAGFALAAAAVIGGILAVPLMINSPIPPTSGGDYPYYATLTELENAATAILVVDIEGEKPGNFEGIDAEVMTARIVIDADRTHPTGDVILIKEMPGEDSLVVGNRYVVFLEEYDDVPASLVNPFQGAYLVRDGRAFAREDNPVALDRELLQRLGLQYEE
jgi:hypothetical protein